MVIREALLKALRSAIANSFTLPHICYRDSSSTWHGSLGYNWARIDYHGADGMFYGLDCYRRNLHNDFLADRGRARFRPDMVWRVNRGDSSNGFHDSTFWGGADLRKGRFASGVTMRDTIIGFLPFIGIQLVVIALCALFPNIKLWLPSKMVV